MVAEPSKAEGDALGPFDQIIYGFGQPLHIAATTVSMFDGRVSPPPPISVANLSTPTAKQLFGHPRLQKDLVVRCRQLSSEGEMGETA